MRVSVLVFLLVVPGAVGSGDVDYNDQENWGGVCNDAGSEKQSPVDIISPNESTKLKGRVVTLSEDADSTDATNLDNPSTIKISFAKDITYLIPGLDDVTGKAEQLHLHWGADDNTGSEHLLDGKQFSAEAHLVTSYGDEGKYAVLARFFKVGEENAQIQKMIDSADSDDETERRISDLDLRALYPNDIEEVITYEGSLTTPDCNEIVHWVVVPEPLTISSDQLAKLRTVSLGNGNEPAKTFNWRNKQDLNGREFKCIKSSATVLLPSNIFLAVVFINIINFFDLA